MSALDFNARLLRVSNKLSAQDLKDLKFMCDGTIGKKHLEMVQSGTQLFQLLVERGHLRADNTAFLSNLLLRVNRPDLAEELDGSEDPSGPADDQPNDTERGNRESGGFREDRKSSVTVWSQSNSEDESVFGVSVPISLNIFRYI